MDKEYSVIIEFEPKNKSWVVEKIEDILGVSSSNSMFSIDKNSMTIFGLTGKEESYIFSQLQDSDKIKNIESQEMMEKGGATKRAYAIYNELWYEVYVDGESVYKGGNSPYDSEVFVSAEEGVGVDKMKKYAEQTGKEIAKEHDAKFNGVQYEKPDDDFEKGGKVKKYSDHFVEVDDLEDTKYFIRTFGKVGTEKNDNIELLAVAEIRDYTDAISEEELEDMTGGKPIGINITLVPIEKWISKKHKKEANDENSSISGNTIVNIVNYMGGLNFDLPKRENSAFNTFEEAEKYLHSKELNEQISIKGALSGFTMDMAYNRIGKTNWERLAYMMGETERFDKGGSVRRPSFDKYYTKFGGVIYGGYFC